MKYPLLTASILLSLSFSVHSAVERLQIPSSFNPVGSGARAMGMGGSFIAIADDATAASWNPAGLIQLRKPEIALVVSSTKLSEDLTFSLADEASGENSVTSSDLNYFAISYPCSSSNCGKNMTFSFNYQRLYDFSREWDLSIDRNAGTLLDIEQRYRIENKGSLYAMGFAYAIQLNEQVTLGFTVNLWRELQDDNEWSSVQNIDGIGTITGLDIIQTARFTDEYSFEGENFNLGLLWTPYQSDEKKLVIGFIYKSEFDADITWTDSDYELEEIPTDDKEPTPSEATKTSELTLTMPSSIGVGLAYQWSDVFTTSLDIYQTYWSDFLFTNDSGGQFSPISGKASEDVSIDDTTQIRFGMEYRIISQEINENYIIPLRAGFFKDSLVSDGSQEDSYGISFGTGIAYDTWVFDIAYQYRWANDIGGSYLQGLGFSQDIDEQKLLGSVFYRF